MGRSNVSAIEKFQAVMERSVVPVATKIASQRHLASIRDGLTVLIPFTIVGGFSVLLAVPPVSTNLQATNFFFKFLLAWKAWATANIGTLMIPYNLTIGIIALYVVCGVSYQLAKSYEMNGMMNMLSALFIFMIIAAAPQALEKGNFMPTANMGAAGMFTGILIAIAVVEINHFFEKRNIGFKLPDSVPPNVAAPFNVLLPMIFNVIFFLILNAMVTSATGAGLTALIYKLFQPLLRATDSLPSVILINILMTTFWFFGIHGANMVGVVTTPIVTMGLAVNAEAYAKGDVMPQVFAGYVNSTFGGWISYLAIVIIILLFAKSSQLKSVGKVAAIPSLFNINEPLIFGLPTVLNIFTYIPALICNNLNFTVVYFLMKSNFINKFFIQLPFTTPGPLQAWLSTADVKTIPLWFALLLVDIIICYPFIKAYDEQVLKTERAE
ncbi:PTS sugar transporter subunit IIC [Fusibacter ferrireducens]|uniref:Permease IIC component n=1 Tax=Fusibacter ferrireducens TaxID=2785058 RepID=A0ABR9ZRY6_9FIRM|nr:PTS transporter subunit EIIC [Fusibacter ferrireducens]MBF4693219.1 PTS sugar transporter subunit IIC [Fusibacter ferrireducens]